MLLAGVQQHHGPTRDNSISSCETNVRHRFHHKLEVSGGIQMMEHRCIYDCSLLSTRHPMPWICSGQENMESLLLPTRPVAVGAVGTQRHHGHVSTHLFQSKNSTIADCLMGALLLVLLCHTLLISHDGKEGLLNTIFSMFSQASNS